MVKYILLFLTLLAFACTSSTKTEKQILNGIENALLIENIDTIALPPIEGNFQFGYQWIDSLGSNLLVFTLLETINKTQKATDPLAGEHNGFFHLYHFSGVKYSALRYHYTDFTESCLFPKSTLNFTFIRESVSFTDLNENGIAEVTFMHQYNCSSQPSLSNTKLILKEGDTLYTITGNSYLGKEYPLSGVKNMDTAFNSAPESFKQHSCVIWETFCKSNPNNQEEKPRPFLSNELLKQITFAGTEPFWGINLRDSNLIYHSVESDTIIMHYTKNRVIGDYCLSDVIESISETEIRIQIVANDMDGLITIKKEVCNDGMSDIKYPYSFSLIWEEEEGSLFGCGIIVKSNHSLEAEKDLLESKLALLISKLQIDSLDNFYTNDIKHFGLYKRNSEFKQFVDSLLTLGYGIEQAEGCYYLYIGEPENFIDGETN